MLRQMQAAVWHVFLGPGELIEESLAATKLFNEKTKGQSGHKFGSPHIQAYRSFLKTVIRALEAKVEEEREVGTWIKILSDHLAKFEAAKVEGEHLYVSQFRVKKARDGRSVVTICFSDFLDPSTQHELLNVFLRSLQLLGCEYKAGSPPATDIERKHQANIDGLKAQLGKK